MNNLIRLSLTVITLFSSTFLMGLPSSIYSVGQNSEGISTLWGIIPRSVTTLNSSGSAASAGYGIAINDSGSTIYSTGINGNKNAALWITNSSGTNTVQLGSTGTSSAGEGVAISSSGSIYIAGIIAGANGTSNANLWITDSNGHTTSSNILDNGNHSVAQGIAINNNDTTNFAYSVGYNSSLLATLWITNSTGTTTTAYSLDNGSGGGHSVSFGVAINNNDITKFAYSTGFNSALPACHATLWITDSTGTTTSAYILDSNNANSTGNAVAVNISAGLVYIVGFDYNSRATLWITNLNGVVQGQPIILNSTSGSEASAVVVSNSNVYVAGNDQNGHAVLWITDSTGTKISTYPLDTNGDSAAYGIAINPIIPSSDVLKAATQLWSPSKILKGNH